MTRLWMSGAAAVMAVSLAGVQAQTTGTQTPTQQPQAQAENRDQQTTTLRGCVYQEKDIPGRSPNVAERAGILEDYILVASPGAAAAGTAGTAGTTPPTGTAGTSGTMRAHKAFKLEHASDDQLRSLVGKMVEVTGKVDAERGDRAAGAATGTAPARDRSVGPDAIELPEFEVTSIRAVEGTCPATPDLKKDNK